MHRITQFGVPCHGLLDGDATEHTGHLGWRSLDGLMDAVVLFERNKRLPLHRVGEQHCMDTFHDLIGSMDGQLEGLEPRTRSEGHGRSRRRAVLGTAVVVAVVLRVLPGRRLVTP